MNGRTAAELRALALASAARLEKISTKGWRCSHGTQYSGTTEFDASAADAAALLRAIAAALHEPPVDLRALVDEVLAERDDRAAGDQPARPARRRDPSTGRYLPGRADAA